MAGAPDTTRIIQDELREKFAKTFINGEFPTIIFEGESTAVQVKVQASLDWEVDQGEWKNTGAPNIEYNGDGEVEIEAQWHNGGDDTSYLVGEIRVRTADDNYIFFDSKHSEQLTMLVQDGRTITIKITLFLHRGSGIMQITHARLTHAFINGYLSDDGNSPAVPPAKVVLNENEIEKKGWQVYEWNNTNGWAGADGGTITDTNEAGADPKPAGDRVALCAVTTAAGSRVQTLAGTDGIDTDEPDKLVFPVYLKRKSGGTNLKLGITTYDVSGNLLTNNTKNIELKQSGGNDIWFKFVHVFAADTGAKFVAVRVQENGQAVEFYMDMPHLFKNDEIVAEQDEGQDLVEYVAESVSHFAQFNGHFISDDVNGHKIAGVRVLDTNDDELLVHLNTPSEEIEWEERIDVVSRIEIGEKIT